MNNIGLERRALLSIDFEEGLCARKTRSTPRLSFDTAYALARRPMFAQALHILKVKAAAEEVVQEVFLYAWMNAETYDGERSNVLTWLRMLCRSRAIDYLRAHAVESRIEVGDWDETAVESASISPELSYETCRRGRALRSAIATLVPNQREVIVLSYYAELSHREIAAQMHIPVGTVKTLIRRSKMMMCENLMLKAL